MESPILDKYKKARDQWYALSGTPLNEPKSYNLGGGQWEPYELRKLREDLELGLSLDPTGLTSFMLLRGTFESYLQTQNFSTYDMLLNRKVIEAKLAPLMALRDMLEDPEVVEFIEGFQRKLRGSGTHYDFKDTKGLKKLLNDKVSLAYVRLDALRSIKTLQAHQFTQGAVSPEKLKYNQKVFEFWNINSLLAACRAQTFDGVSLVLLRDPVEPLHSYFAVAIRDAETITVLTDMTEWAHPGQKHMTRRPDKRLDDRAEKHRFPYQLLDLKVDPGQTRMYAAARTAIVPINAVAAPIKDIGELEPDQFVWLTMLFDLVNEVYHRAQKMLPELSYTGERVVNPQALVGPGSAIVKSGQYRPLELAPLTREDVTEKTTAAQWDHKPTGFNRWMEERYADKVPESVLSPVGEPQRLLLAAKPEFQNIMLTHETPARHGTIKWGRNKAELQIRALDPMQFGTKEAIIRDRLWTARMNQTQMIQMESDKEYEATKDEVLKWCADRIAANREFLLDAAAKGSLKLPNWKWKSETGESFPRHDVLQNKGEVEALQQAEGRDYWTAFRKANEYGGPQWQLGSAFQIGKMDSMQGCFCAEDTVLKATVFSFIEAATARDLVVLFGVPFDELPWQLQHWTTREPYDGNSILDRIDPQDWVLKNPWMKLDFRVAIAQSKTAFNARRLKLGLPKKIWNPSKPKES